MKLIVFMCLFFSNSTDNSWWSFFATLVLCAAAGEVLKTLHINPTCKKYYHIYTPVPSPIQSIIARILSRLFYCMSHKLLKYEFYEIFHILHNMCNISWPPTSSVQQTSASHNGIDQNLTDIGVWNIADKQWYDGSMAGYHPTDICLYHLFLLL